MKETELIRQYAENNITMIYANATAVATDIMMRSESNATKLEYEGYAVAYSTLKNNVDMSDNNAFISFMFAETVSKYSKNANLNIGFSKPVVLLNNQQSPNPQFIPSRSPGGGL